jgi:phage FluMu protein Com
MPEPRVTTYSAESKRDVPDLELETGLEMEPVRCPKCGRFLCYQAIVAGYIRIKCRKCKLWVTTEYIPKSELDIFEKESYNEQAEVEEDDRAEGEPQDVPDRPEEIES